MSRLPDLVRDSKLETRFVPDFSVETVHTYHESEPARRRLVSVLEHWKRQEKIGGGGYSTVWLESCPKVSRQGVQVRAVKQIETGGRFARIDFNRELEAIAKFSHPKYERCFVKSFGWYNTPENLFISMEYLKLGDLHDYLLDRPPLSESQAQDISYQILEGLQMMHENEFMHRDLKPKNILIKSHPPQEWWIKIADFGISKRMEESPETSTTLRGTAGFIAPELYGFIKAGSLYSPDIWSLGEIIFQILTKKPAFKPIGQLVSYMRQPEMFPSAVLNDAGVTEIGIEFVRSLMDPIPDSRLTTDVALGHAWMQAPSEILSTSEARPVPTVHDYQNPTETDEQRIESHTEVEKRGSETLRPKGKTKGMVPKVATVEDYDSTDEDSPSSPLLSGTLEEYGSPMEKDTLKSESLTEIQANGSEALGSSSKAKSTSLNMAPDEDRYATDERGAHALKWLYNNLISSQKQRLPGGWHEDYYATDEESDCSARSSAAVHGCQTPSQKQRQRGGLHERVDSRGPDIMRPRSMTKGVSPNMAPADDDYATDKESLFSGLSGYAVSAIQKAIQVSKSHEDIHEKVSETPSLSPRKPIPSRTERQHTESQNRIADWLSNRNCHLINEKDKFPPISLARALAYYSTGVRNRRQPSVYEMPWRETRIPRKLLHPRAIRERGYPFKAEKNTIIIQRVLSEEQVDELISHSNACKGLQGIPTV
ncbi:kinase-like domain-containing protein [Penicillium waksmanii]|uniref:kinase-like domain-containing protein n=1 Tax=Penicillium waksmanii TaxID=69791 RepID=UPI002547C026|nr:kinase-like domain-containing protein [Penicillium waksmanii]KAJ5974082.1 kinase-like domain-containing protein [Penicillium waksmanii]